MSIMMHRRLTLVTLLGLAAITGGCAPSVRLATPATPLPPRFETTMPAQADVALERWWDGFSDAQLSGLIDEALANGTDARSAYFRIREAKAVRDQSLASRLPTGNISGSAKVQDGSQLSGTDIAGATARTTSLGLSFAPSWELDLFGRLGAVGRSARATYEAAAYDYYGTRLALAAEVANALFQARSLAVQHNDAQDTLRIAAELAKTSALGRDRGLVSAGDTARLETDEASARAEVTRIDTALRNARRSLLVLVGRADAPIDSLPIEPRLDTPPALPAVTPSILLTRRPDVLTAQARLAAAADNVTIDRAALFPRVDLLGSGSLSRSSSDIAGSSGTGPVVSATGLWSIGLGLGLPILDRPRLMAQLRATQARGEQAVVAYEAAVQDAFRDADTALASVAADRQRLADLEHATERARYAFDAARRGYGLGLTDLTTLLQSERSWRAARSTLTTAQAQALVNVVAAYRALGGGWSPGADATAPGQPPLALPVAAITTSSEQDAK